MEIIKTFSKIYTVCKAIFIKPHFPYNKLGYIATPKTDLPPTMVPLESDTGVHFRTRNRH